jgi:hypothetical protein
VAAPATADCPGVSNPERSTDVKTTAIDSQRRKRILTTDFFAATECCPSTAKEEPEGLKQKQERFEGFIEEINLAILTQN